MIHNNRTVSYYQHDYKFNISQPWDFKMIKATPKLLTFEMEDWICLDNVGRICCRDNVGVLCEFDGGANDDPISVFR